MTTPRGGTSPLHEAARDAAIAAEHSGVALGLWEAATVDCVRCARTADAVLRVVHTQLRAAVETLAAIPDETDDRRWFVRVDDVLALVDTLAEHPDA